MMNTGSMSVQQYPYRAVPVGRTTGRVGLTAHSAISQPTVLLAGVLSGVISQLLLLGDYDES